MELSISNKLFRNIKNNRWEHEFSEREKIGAGGFASVYKATNCFDDHSYAVKKISLQFKDIRRNFEQELQKVLDEAKILAKLKHDNILRYYGSWLEATTKPNRIPKKNLSILPSIFRREKEILNNLHIDSNVESEKDENEVDSPLVIFGDTDNREESPQVKKKENVNAHKLSRFAGRKLNLRPEEGLKIDTKMRAITPEPDECVTPLIRGEKLENIILFIQTELCSDNLESYLDSRNELLQQLKKNNEDEYQKKRKEYLREALAFAKQILNGLSHIHSQFIVHRDLKPSNIFIVDKVCKIGDFGLVKQLVSFYPLENSPFSEKEDLKSVSSQDSIKETTCNDHYPSQVSKRSSYTFINEKEFHSDNVTKHIGTRMYASPEQWMADKETFDYRADIFSLGITFLLLFHPMSTYMERTTIVKESKEGKIPESLEKELPEIAEMIKKMLSSDPASRPSIEKIMQSLQLPSTILSQFSGHFYFRKENSSRWRKKYFKVIDGGFNVYGREHDRKAENIYILPQWKLKLQGIDNGNNLRSTKVETPQTQENEANEAYIKFENLEQIGFEIKLESPNELEELFKGLEGFAQKA